MIKYINILYRVVHLPNDMERETISEIKKFKSEYKKQLAEIRLNVITRITVKMKIDLKIRGRENREFLQKNIDKSLKESVNIGWTRIDSFDERKSSFVEWLCEIAYIMTIIKVINKFSEKAFETLYRLYYQNIYFRVFNLFNQRNMLNVSEVEEIALKIFIKIFKYIKNYNPYKGAFYTWMIKIIENSVNDYKMNLKEISLDYLSEINENSDDSEINIYDKYFKNTDSPEILEEKESKSVLIFKTLFEVKSTPWQLLTVLVSKSGYSGPEIIDKFGDMSLYCICEFLMKEYKHSSNIDEKIIKANFNKINLLLKKNVSETFLKGDNKSKILERNILIETGEIELSCFFGEKPLKNIRDWNHRIALKMRKILTSSDKQN